MITLISLSFLGTVALFALYLAYCTLRVARGNGKLAMAPAVVRGLCWALLLAGLVLDILFNIFIGSLMFREWPNIQRLTFTARCTSHLKVDGFRGNIARWVCEGWLNPFEADHCR